MQIIGHRGAAGLAPENTIASITKALELGVDYVEFDVRQTKDGHIILIHDTHTGRVAADKLKVDNSAMSDLQALPMRRGQPLPSLDEAVAAIGDRAKINIEIKDPSCADQVAELVKTYAKGKKLGYDHFIVSSFSPAALRAMHKLNKDIPLALLQIWPTRFLWLRSVKLTAVGFYAPTVTTGLAIKLAKKRGLMTYAYTVNSTKEAARLEKLGLDGIVTDFPDRFLPAQTPKTPLEAKRTLQTTKTQ